LNVKGYFIHFKMIRSCHIVKGWILKLKVSIVGLSIIKHLIGRVKDTRRCFNWILMDYWLHQWITWVMCYYKVYALMLVDWFVLFSSGWILMVDGYLSSDLKWLPWKNQEGYLVLCANYLYRM
jgi:hypothetical protein